jgi:hypothetical protein
MKPTIAILNRSTVLADAAFPPVIAALQKQVSGDFAPYWGKDADLAFVSKASQPPPGSWQVVVADTVAVAGALGYHDFTAQGMPLGKVGAQTTMQYGGAWSVTLGHEVLEMLGDPDIIRAAFVQARAFTAMIFAYEACDAVEDDSLAYDIDGVKMTDFVTQEWFEPGRTGVPFSFRKSVTKPLSLAPGGYISVYRVGMGRWTQITARRNGQLPGAATLGVLHDESLLDFDLEHVASGATSYSKIPAVGSRRERRNRPRHEWFVSAPVYVPVSHGGA